MAGTCSIDIVRIHHWPPCESFAGSQKENSPLAAGSPFFFISLPLDGWDLSLDGWDGAREKGGDRNTPIPYPGPGRDRRRREDYTSFSGPCTKPPNMMSRLQCEMGPSAPPVCNCIRGSIRGNGAFDYLEPTPRAVQDVT